MKHKTIITILFALLIGFVTTTNLFSQEFEGQQKVTWNTIEGAKQLIASGADINQQDNLSGYTPLMHALNSKNKELAQLLIEHGADFKIKGKDGATALILACGVSPDLAKLLLLKGADIHVRTDKGLGVFSQCVMGMLSENENITPEFARFLLAEGAEIDEANTLSWFAGYTPLFWAVTYNNETVVEFLSKNGANVNAKAKNGKTPLSIASENGFENIVTILKAHGAK